MSDYPQPDACDKAESLRVEEAAKRLGEDYDAVVILCTRHDAPGGTRTLAKGSGNWHARLGLVREYLLATEEQIRREAP